MTDTVCPACNAPASGKFCSNCGAPLAGATCSSCGASLTPGSKFCHRCGAAAGAAAQAGAAGAKTADGFGTALPWVVAAIALVALVALVAGQRFGRRTVAEDSVPPSLPAATAPDRPGGSLAGRAPDISNMTPSERASRLFDRIMSYHERGVEDSVQIFAPMAVAAYEMLGQLNADQHYDLGRIGEVSGDLTLARAQADTILTANPRHLLGLILAGEVARASKDQARAREYESRLARAAATERAKQLPEYTEHQTDIDSALAIARRR